MKFNLNWYKSIHYTRTQNEINLTKYKRPLVETKIKTDASYNICNIRKYSAKTIIIFQMTGD